MNEKDFALRLAALRTKKNVSAREMSLSIGQNPGYINHIETGQGTPSLAGIFYICEYLGVTPSEFFDLDSKNPAKLSKINAYLFAEFIITFYFILNTSNNFFYLILCYICK